MLTEEFIRHGRRLSRQETKGQKASEKVRHVRDNAAENCGPAQAETAKEGQMMDVHGKFNLSLDRPINDLQPRTINDYSIVVSNVSKSCS